MGTPKIGSSALVEVDIVVSVGSDNSFQFNFQEPDGSGGYASVDLSGWSGAAQIRVFAGDTDVLLDMTPFVSLTSGGDVNIDIPGAGTQPLAVAGKTRGVWDLELTETAGGRIVRLVEGKVDISQDVTRPVVP